MISTSIRGAVSKTAETYPQTGCHFFRIPAELRNEVYFYLYDFESQSLNPPGSDEHDDNPKINLLHARQHAPSNALLASCRVLYHEARDVFVKGQKDFWSKSTFTISLEDDGTQRTGGPDDLYTPKIIDYPERVRNEHIEAISNIAIDVEEVFNGEFQQTITLAAGPEASGWGGFWKVACESRTMDSKWTRVIPAVLEGARRRALEAEMLPQTYERMKANYEYVKTRVKWQAWGGADVESVEVASERIGGEIRESVAMFERALQSMKRLELMLIVECCCDSWGVMWEE